MKRTYKRITFAILAGISLTASLIGTFPAIVSAAGETYVWKDFNTIVVSGGDLRGSIEFKLVQGSNPERFASTSPVEHSAGCDLRSSINVSGNTSGTLVSPLPGDPQGPQVRPEGAVYCSDMHEVCSGIWPFRSCHLEPRFPGISASYNNQTISIQGTRPGSGNQSETDQQKSVSVTINAPNPANASPDTITIEVKDASGNVVQSATPGQEAALGSDDPNNPNFIEPDLRPVRYHHTFRLDPGRYTVCASIVIPDCRAFEKKKFESLTLEYGETSSQRSVIAKITVDYVGGPQNMTVGPLEVTLRKPDGSVITVRTGTREHKMTNEEEQANGLITVTYSFELEGEFKAMDPATYEVCVVGLAECKNVVKQSGADAIVNFRIDWNAFSED
ncbi:MAG: hypothetical protein AAB834_04655, partial [Patescibacteria group bacterium]